MFFYLAQYSLISLLGLVEPRRINKNVYKALYFILFFTVGLRYEVGGDWGTYLVNYRKFSIESLGVEDFIIREPGWLFFTYISKLISQNEIWPLNLMCAGIFLIGIESICRSTNRKYLALAICYPILIVLVGMGYTRQSVALGFCFLSLKYLDDNKSKFLLFTILGFVFHNTSIIFSFVIYLFTNKNKLPLLKPVILIMVIYLAITYSSLYDYFYNMSNEYLYIAGYHALGAIPRGIPIAIAALGFLLIPNYAASSINFNSNVLVLAISIFIVMIFMGPFTAFDRIFLYFSPIYILFFSNLSVDKKSYSNFFYELTIYIIFLIYLIIWFSYGVNYSFWEPYDNYLFHLEI